MDHHEVQAGCFGHLLTRKARSKAPHNARRAFQDDKPQMASKSHVHQDASHPDLAEKTVSERIDPRLHFIPKTHKFA